MLDPFLERERELLRLNATLNSKCGSLDEERSRPPGAIINETKAIKFGNKVRHRNGKGGGVHDAGSSSNSSGSGGSSGKPKSKCVKSTTTTTRKTKQSIKLKMSYEKVDIKSYYEDLSKSILRLDLNASPPPPPSSVASNANDGPRHPIEQHYQHMEAMMEFNGRIVETDTKPDAIEKTMWRDEQQQQPTHLNGNGAVSDAKAEDTGDVNGFDSVAADITARNKRQPFTNANPIEKFLNEFTVDPNKLLNIDPAGNATGHFRSNAGFGMAASATTTTTTTRATMFDAMSTCSAASVNGKEAPLNIIPKNFLRRNVSADGLIKFLKAKVVILQQELDLSHKENSKHTDNLGKTVEAQKKLEQLRDQTTNKNNTLKTQIQKLEDQNADLELKLKERDATQSSLRRELDEAKSKLKTTQQSVSVLEVRLFKSQEDLDYLRKNYYAAKDLEKNLQGTMQQERKFYENQLKMMQKQRADLIAAHKKQLLLLDNLKRQNTCLEHAKLLQIGEKEFTRILDWKPDEGK